jgi:hypothetical protein
VGNYSGALAAPQLSTVREGLRWRGARLRLGEKSRQGYAQRPCEAIEQVQRRVALLALKLAQPAPGHGGVALNTEAMSASSVGWLALTARR